MYLCILFPRVSERRVLVIVEVCHHIFTSSSSHLLIFTSSHLLHIFSSSHHLHIFLSSHLSSSHLLVFIFTSSHLHILPFRPLALLPSCPLALFSLPLTYFSLKARGSANEAPRNAALSHEMRSDRQNHR